MTNYDAKKMWKLIVNGHPVETWILYKGDEHWVHHSL